MSVQAMSWVMSHSLARLGDRLVVLAIANHADAQGRAAWPSIVTIADETLMSIRQVQRAIRHLEELGEIEIDPLPGPHGVHRYSIPMQDRMSPLPASTGDNLSGEGVTGCHQGGDKSGTDSGQDVTQTFLREPPKEVRKKELSALRADFAAWYAAFPRRVGKSEAEKAYAKARTKASATELLDGIAHYRAGKPDYADWSHPASWLNKGRWLDEYSEGDQDDGPRGPPPKPEDLWPDLKLVGEAG